MKHQGLCSFCFSCSRMLRMLSWLPGDRSRCRHSTQYSTDMRMAIPSRVSPLVSCASPTPAEASRYITGLIPNQSSLGNVTISNRFMTIATCLGMREKRGHFSEHTGRHHLGRHHLTKRIPARKEGVVRVGHGHDSQQPLGVIKARCGKLQLPRSIQSSLWEDHCCHRPESPLVIRFRTQA